MWKTVVRRLLVMIPQIIILSMIVFTVAHFMQVDPCTGQLDPNIDPQQLEALREAAVSNDPLSIQYFRCVGNVRQGDYGNSYSQQVQVTTLNGSRASNSLRLGLMATFFTY